MERMVIGVNIKERKTTNLIRNYSRVTDIFSSIREINTGVRDTWRRDVTIDGKAESHTNIYYHVDIKDLDTD